MRQDPTPDYCMDNLVCALEYGIKPRAISSADGAKTKVLARWSDFLGQTGKDKTILTHIVTWFGCRRASPGSSRLDHGICGGLTQTLELL